jgi:hypothetical protein
MDTSSLVGQCISLLVNQLTSTANKNNPKPIEGMSEETTSSSPCTAPSFDVSDFEVMVAIKGAAVGVHTLSPSSVASAIRGNLEPLLSEIESHSEAAPEPGSDNRHTYISTGTFLE